MKDILGFVVVFAVFVIGLFFIIALFGGTAESFSKKEKLPYQKKKYFFSEAERKFYVILKQITDKNNLVLFSHVRLVDLFLIYGKDRFSYGNRIKQKHIDFLICEYNNFSPVLGIELDDSSHNLEKRMERDDFVDKVFDSAGLPLLRIKVSFDYDINFLEQNILQNISKN